MKNKDKEYQLSDLEDVLEHLKKTKVTNASDFDFDKAAWVIENGEDDVLYDFGACMGSKAFARQFLEHLDKALREKVKEMTNPPDKKQP